MATYYISYGEPPRRPRWVYFVLGMATMAAVLAVGATVWFLPLFYEPISTAEESGPQPPEQSEPASPEQWYEAIAKATNETAITYYLVDTSESMTRELPNALAGLNAIIAARAPESEVGVIAFGDTCAEPLPLLPLSPPLAELAAQGNLVKMEIGMAGIGTDASCALEQALATLQPLAKQRHDTEVVLFSDGSLADVIDAECNGTVSLSARTLEERPLFQCSGGWSHEPMPIIAEFAAAGIKINGIYFQPHQFDWAEQVKMLADATEGEFVPVRPQAEGRAMR